MFDINDYVYDRSTVLDFLDKLDDNDVADKEAELNKKYVNVAKYSDKIGTKLAMGYPAMFSSVLGKVGTIRTAMDYLTIPEYPKALLGKPSLSKNDIDKIPKVKPTLLENHNAALAYILAERLYSDETLRNMLKEETREIVSYNKSMVNNFMGETIVYSSNNKLFYYTVILRAYVDMIRQDKFDKEHIVEFINTCKYQASKDVFAGSVVKVTSQM